MRLVVIGLNHKTAPVSTREAFAIPTEAVHGIDRRILLEPAVAEVMTLSTCNRVEVYAVAQEDTAATLEALGHILATERGLDIAELGRHGYRHEGDAAIRHLIRVCSSLDSLVVGEAQILAQVREAYNAAREAGTVGPILEQVVQAAFRGGKAVRTDTGIAEETVSIGSVAVELAKRIFPKLEKTHVLVIGAGKMGRVTARSLARAGVAEVIVTNRSPERAERLAKELGWTARPFGELDELLIRADVVLTCTGADRPILDGARLKPVMKRRKGRPLFLVDIAVPRDVSPSVAELDQVYLYNIDDLEAVSREHLQRRLGEAEKAEKIVEEAVSKVIERLSTHAVVPVLKAVRDKVEDVTRKEVEKALAKRLAHLPASDKEAVLAATIAAMNKVLHPAMTALREHTGARFDLATAARLLYGVDSTTAESTAASPSDTLALQPEELH